MLYECLKEFAWLHCSANGAISERSKIHSLELVFRDRFADQGPFLNLALELVIFEITYSCPSAG
jgi:hypothetical protein